MNFFMLNTNLNTICLRAIALTLVGIGTFSLTSQIAQASSVTNTKNVIIMIGVAWVGKWLVLRRFKNKSMPEIREIA
jgi:hypothetical protein